MNLRSLRALRGPNLWAPCPVIEATLDLTDFNCQSADSVRAILERVGATFSIKQPLIFEGEKNPHLRLAGAFARVALELQAMAGDVVSFTAIWPSGTPGLILAANEYAEEPVGRQAAVTAWNHLQAAVAGRAPSVQDDLCALRKLAYQRRLPASTAAICQAARARAIPVSRLNPEYSRYLRLGQGSRQRRCLASEPDTVTSVARVVSTDKYLTKQLLADAGVPIPLGRLVTTAEQAWAAACTLGFPVAIKPQDCDLATGVSLDLRSRAQVEEGFRRASEHSSWVLVEHFAPGTEHRVLVVEDQVVAVTRIDPPQVTGDGHSSIAELVERVNRDLRRGDEKSNAPCRWLKIDDEAARVLDAQGLNLSSVPPAGRQVLIRRNPPYFKNGGNLVDVTDAIHPSIASHAVAAARALQLSVAGLDVVALDIRRPLEDQCGVIVEVNAGPGLWLHLAPWADGARPVGEAIVAALFPPGDNGRIPVIALVGDTSGSARHYLTALLTDAGLRVGCASETEIVAGGRRWRSQASTPQERASQVLHNAIVDVVLLETSPRELVLNGFGTDRCDVALILNNSLADLLSVREECCDEGPSASEFVSVLLHALAENGTFVMSVGGGTGLYTGLPPIRHVLVAHNRNDSQVGKHLAAGGQAIVLEGDIPVMCQGQTVVNLGQTPIASKCETLGLLAALAAGLALGLTVERQERYLQSGPCRKERVSELTGSVAIR